MFVLFHCAFGIEYLSDKSKQFFVVLRAIVFTPKLKTINIILICKRAVECYSRWAHNWEEPDSI